VLTSGPPIGGRFLWEGEAGKLVIGVMKKKKTGGAGEHACRRACPRDRAPKLGFSLHIIPSETSIQTTSIGIDMGRHRRIRESRVKKFRASEAVQDETLQSSPEAVKGKGDVGQPSNSKTPVHYKSCKSLGKDRKGLVERPTAPAVEPTVGMGQEIEIINVRKIRREPSQTFQGVPPKLLDITEGKTGGMKKLW